MSTRTLSTLIGTLLLASPALAREQVLIETDKPYWEVGVRDNLLARACSLTRFTPIALGHFVARFNGDKGAGILDIATGRGQNLYDPKHQAKPNEVYYFRNSGTTSCEVFVGGRSKAK